VANPQTLNDFTPRRRAVIILVFGGLWTLGSFATDLFLPAMPAAADSLGASESAVALSVTTFLIGLGLGQLIAGPVSDGRGRRPTLLVGLVVFTASAVVCIFAPSVEVLIMMRLVQGMAAAFGLAIPNAMVTDYARGREAARLFSRIVIIGGVAPLVASLTGAQMLRLLGWRGPFAALTAIGLFALVCVALWLPESLPRQRRVTGGLRTALRTMAGLTRDGRFLGYTLTGDFVYMAFFAYLGGSSFVFQHQYGISATTYSILFAVNAVGMLAAGQANHRLLARFSPRSLLVAGLIAFAVAGVAVVVPIFERRAPGLYHNSALTLDADGRTAGHYRKMHIPDDPAFYEKFYFTPGDLGFQAVDTRFGRVGTLICWDQWYPEGARLTALRGASVLFYPTAIGWHPAEKAEHGAHQRDAWRTIQRGHAIANGCYVAAVNRVGHEPGPTPGAAGLEFWGSSFLADPFGVVVAEGSVGQEEILVAEIDLARIEEVRRNWPFLRDRRVDAYGGIEKRFLD
jgi:N-carbamoylputrescine amidase